MAAAVIVTSIISLAQAQDTAPKKSPELKVLDRYVGTWLHEATLLPSKSTPEKTTRRAVEQTEWTLSNSFLMSRAVNETDGLKSFSFFTVNRSDQTTYPFWYLGSSGDIGHLKGKWDESSRAMIFSSPDVPPSWKGAVTHKFSDDFYNSSMAFTNDAGETMMDRHDIRTRQAGIAGKGMLETWAKIGTPPSPLPEELQRLARLVGKWTETQSMRIPAKFEARNELIFEWILDGRFLFGSTKSANGKLTRLRVIGFDTNSKEYRLFSFAAGRKASEALGRWDDKTGLVNWRMAQEPKGVTSTATWEFADDGSVDWHVTRKSKDKTLMELMIRLERQKTRQ
jgi:hypothetical protein